jgi:hypothetical protein
MRIRKFSSIFCEKMVLKMVKKMLFSLSFSVAFAEYSVSAEYSAEYTAENLGRRHFRSDTSSQAYLFRFCLYWHHITADQYCSHVSNFQPKLSLHRSGLGQSLNINFGFAHFFHDVFSSSEIMNWVSDFSSTSRESTRQELYFHIWHI